MAVLKAARILCLLLDPGFSNISNLIFIPAHRVQRLFSYVNYLLTFLLVYVLARD